MSTPALAAANRPRAISPRTSRACATSVDLDLGVGEEMWLRLSAIGYMNEPFSIMAVKPA